MLNIKRWPIVAVFLLLCSRVTSAQVTNENPPAPESYAGDACAVLLDDIAVSGGFIRACSGDNGALGHLPNCPVVGFGPVGLRIDPDGPGGPLVESEDSNEGFFEERWCLEYDTAAANINRCNTSSAGTGMPGFTQVDTSTPGQLQATGNLTTPELVRVDQSVTLVSGSRCVKFDVTLTNQGATTLNNVEYLRNHDPDLGIRMSVGFPTDNQTLNRPLPPGPLPTLVAATVRDFSPVETRTVGLGTDSAPPAGVAADVSINNGGLIQSDPDAVFSGAGVNRGPTFADVGNTLAFRTPSLDPAQSVNHRFCYCFASALTNQDRPTALADIAAVMANECIFVIEVDIDVKPQSFPNCFNINGKGVVPVAILGSATFDVTEIDVSTLNFGGLDVRVKRNGTSQCSVEDVSGDFTNPEGAPDGIADLVCKFVNDAGSWSPNGETASLTGNLLPQFGGTPIEGTDSICLRPPE